MLLVSFSSALPGIDMVEAAKPVHRDEVATFDSIGGVMTANLARRPNRKSTPLADLALKVSVKR